MNGERQPFEIRQTPIKPSRVCIYDVNVDASTQFAVSRRNRISLKEKCHGWFISKEYSKPVGGLTVSHACTPCQMMPDAPAVASFRFLSSTDSIAKTIFGVFLAEFFDGWAHNFSTIISGDNRHE